MRTDEPFFSVPRTVRETSEGPVELPILYYDTSVIISMFLVDRDAAEAEVRAAGLRPALSRGGRTIAVLASYDYRATTVGPYFEVGLAIPVVPMDAPSGQRWLQALAGEESARRDLGYHVLHLPVSTAAANAAGRELWGLPKFVTSMDVRLHGGEVLARVDDPDGGEPVMELEGRAGVGIPGPMLPIVLYSHVDGHMVRTTVNARGGNVMRTGGSVRLSVGSGGHPMARTMHRLGLAGARPIGLLTTHRFQSRLNLGVPVDGRSRSIRSAAAV